MNNWALKLEEATGCDDLNNLADDVVQSVALASIGVLLMGWFFMLL